jgi:hypothetical protein
VPKDLADPWAFGAPVQASRQERLLTSTIVCNELTREEPIRMNEEVTVVCAAWHKQKNLEFYFHQHARCLLGQTIPAKIIYVCDGGLTLEPPDPRVTTVTVSEGIRTAEALNIGLVLTNTPFFAALNLDDFYFKNALEIHVGALKQLDADAFFGDWEIRFTEEGDTDRMAFDLSALQPCKNWPPEKAEGLRLGNSDGHRGTWGPAPVFKTEALKSVCGYPKRFGDGSPIQTIIDFITWDRLLKSHKKVSRGSIVVGSYYSNPEIQQEFRGGGTSGVINEHRLYEQCGAMI